MSFMNAKGARPVDDPKALVPFGWAPGGYHCAACSICGEAHSGSDKRSIRCQDCAEALRDKRAAEPAPTTRETADHIGEANEKVADHIGDATTMIDHAELARLAEAATLGKWQNGIDDCEGVVALAEHTGNVICLPPTDDMQASLEFWPRNAAFIAAANPATVLALLSEIAALRGRENELIATHAVAVMRIERQRDDMVKALRSIAEGNLGDEPWQANYETIKQVARNAIANQGADQ